MWNKLYEMNKKQSIEAFIKRLFAIHSSDAFTQEDFIMLVDALMVKYQVSFFVNKYSRDIFFEMSNSEAYNTDAEFTKLCNFYMDFDYIKDANPATCEN